MDLLNTFMNMVAPFTLVTSLFFIIPPLYFYRFVVSLLASFNPENMHNKVVVITGASSGIGEQLAYQYATRGARLVLVARREERLREIADRAQEMGSPDVMVVPADVSKIDECQRFIDQVVNHMGRLDHLVNNPGIACSSMFEESSDIANFSSVMDKNFWGLVYPTHFALPHLREKKGRIVVTSSAASYMPLPRMSFYNASKAALTNFYETLRMEFGGDIGVTIATPGWIESEMLMSTKDAKIVTNQEIRYSQMGFIVPVEKCEVCARRIVEAACQGKRYVIEPLWFRILFVYRFLVPELVDLAYRVLYVPSSGSSEHDTLSNKLVNFIGAKKFMYPSSIRAPPVESTDESPRLTTEKVKKAE